MSHILSTKSTVPGAAAMTTSNSTSNRAAALPLPARRTLQNFLLMWFDANCNEINVDFKNSLKYLWQVVASIETFTDAKE